MRKNGQYGTENELIEALALHDEKALDILYNCYWQKMYIAAYNILKDRALSEDIVQEIFVRIWQNTRPLDIKTSLLAYLLAATRYQVFTAIKKRTVRAEILKEIAQGFERFELPELQVEKKLTEMHIAHIVEELPAKCKTIYKLSRESHLSYKHISELLEVSPKTVENQISIALKRIRKALGAALFSGF